MTVYYVAVLARNSEDEIFVTIPDLPGVNSAAATRAEALALAIEFANDYVRDLVEDGHAVPAARDFDEIPVDPEDEEIGRALLPVDMPGKSVKVSISLDEALLARIDRAAEGSGLTRSGFIAAAAEDRIRGSVPLRAARNEEAHGAALPVMQIAPTQSGVFISYGMHDRTAIQRDPKSGRMERIPKPRKAERKERA